MRDKRQHACVVYILYVTWSDESTNVIYRRYSRFFDFQSQLMEMFPEEAGALDPQKRIIPFLPGKKFFGRSHIREVALKRMGPIAEYCKAIVNLPRKISQCRDILEFFELEPDDIDPPKGRKQSVKANKISKPKPLEVYVATSEYRRQEKGEVTLQVGMLVEVVEKTQTGWWFVNVDDEQGWVPSTCLAREDGAKEDTTERLAPGQEEQYLCTEEFKAQSADELSMERGAVVDVIEKNFEGWWIVRYGGREGYVPATYLIKAESFKVRRKGGSAHQPHQGPQIVKSLHEISDLLKGDRPPSTFSATTPALPTTEEPLYDDNDDVFDDDYADPDEDKIYTVQELSRILKEDRHGCAETEDIYDSIKNIQSRSLQRCGSSRPPPRPSATPSHGGVSPGSQKPVLKRQPSEMKEYVTIASFSDPVGDGISFEQGQTVQVLEKSENGWWFISIEGVEGWAPATYIEERTPVADKPRALSPVRASQEAACQRPENAVESDQPPRRNSAVETLGGLASALKSKIKSKGNKSPPTPPKKDFLDVEPDNQSSIGRLKFQPVLPAVSKVPQIVLTKPADKPTPSMSGKPAVKNRLDRAMQPPPPPPPGKQTSEPKPVPVPPAKPQPNVSSPTRTDFAPSLAQLSSNKAQKGVSLAAPLRPVSGVKPAPPHAMKPQGEEKAAFPKPTLPKKLSPDMGRRSAALQDIGAGRKSAASRDSERVMEQVQINFSQLAGALKAKLETKEEHAGQASSVKPTPPVLAKKPPGIGVKSSEFGAKTPVPKPISHSGSSSDSGVGNELSSGSENDLANVLKAKFEKRQQTSDSPAAKVVPGQSTTRDSQPVKAVLKPMSKPARPLTPPAPRKGDATERPRPVFTEPKKTLDPKKYSSRPLPPSPNAPVLASDKLPPAVPLKPATKARLNGQGEEASDNEGRVGSQFINALKNRLGDQNDDTTTKRVSNAKPLETPKIEVSDVRNNNSIVKPESKELTCVAIADYEGSSPGEIRLVVGENYEILDTCNGWWFVSNNCSEGWAPETYLEPVAGHKDSKEDGSSSEKKMSRACSDFQAENAGELSVFYGEEVEVLEEAEGGWCFVHTSNGEGWVPTSYIMNE